jgi:hypothetical protein
MQLAVTYKNGNIYFMPHKASWTPVSVGILTQALKECRETNTNPIEHSAS